MQVLYYRGQAVLEMAGSLLLGPGLVGCVARGSRRRAAPAVLELASSLLPGG